MGADPGPVAEREDFMFEKAAGVCASVFQPLSADEEHQQEHAPRLDLSSFR